jgi:hypothetical protein
MKKGFFSILAVLAVLAMVTLGCPTDSDDDTPTPVTPPTTTAVVLNTFTANGAASPAVTTTALTLTFDKAITGLTANDITLTGTGFTKGVLSGTGPSYTLGVTVTAAGSVTVTAVTKTGYTVTGVPKTANTFYDASATPVELTAFTANGSATTTTTQLTLTFDKAITGLTAADITLSGTGFTKGTTLGGTAPAYTLPITVTAAGTVTVTAVTKQGYNVTGTGKTATTYFASSQPPKPPTGDFFEDAIGLTTGIGFYGTGTHSFDDEEGILSIYGNGGFSVELPAGFTVADTVEITYAARVVSDENVDANGEQEDRPIKFIKKQGSGWTDVGDANKYPAFVTDDVGTITVTGFSAEGVAAGKVFFQTNADKAAQNIPYVWEIKIISVTRIEGDPIMITAAVTGLKPVAGEAPKTSVETVQYTGTVAWAPAVSGNFVAGTTYSATIVLTPKTAYTFEGVEANEFSVVGAKTVNHAAGGAGALTITAGFDATAAAVSDKNITFSNVSEIVGNNIEAQALIGTTGFSFKTTQGYDWAYGGFKVDFGGTVTLGDYSKLTFTYQGVSGDDLGNKNIRVWVLDGATAPTGSKADADAVKTGSVSGTTKYEDLTVDLDKFAPLATSHEVYVMFNIWSNANQEFSISDIKFHN